MRQSIRKYLKTLPEPYRREALMNATISPTRNIDTYMVSSLGEAISSAFVWMKTLSRFPNQGQEYWANIRERATSGEFYVK